MARREPTVVGIGASAGGLDAFKKFLAAMPLGSDIAFVLIPHLDPTHQSLMVELLSRYTAMSIVEAEEGIPVEANRVYIIPPNKYMTISGGLLRLTGPVERRGMQTSIDLFLRSLAEDRHEKAVCIILSGTGSHGSLGLKAVKAAGGMAMVQEPNTAEYDRMPLSAIATGLADYVLPVEQMPEALIKYVQHFRVNGDKIAEEIAETPDDLKQVLALLRARTGFDFRCYRKKMLARRIERRMGLHHLHELADYLKLLRSSPEEATQLSRDLLIGVTNFFREPEAFRALETEVIPSLTECENPDEVIRVWVPGCATGEEPYSIAILVLEQLTKARSNCRVQVFATDMDEAALEVARVGIYPESITADISPERLERFFTRVDESGYRVKKVLRDCVTFAAQNLISDPPFSRMDLVSCRNVLIYLEPEVQKRVIPLLHFALRARGCLVLGPAETIGRQTDLFEPIVKKWRIYRRIGKSRLERVQFPILAPVEHRGHGQRPLEEVEPAPGRFADLAENALLEEFAPAAVLINRKYEILYFFGPTTDYLDVPTGAPTFDLTAMAREGLRTKIRHAVHKALEGGQQVTLADSRVKRGATYQPVILTVKPLQNPAAPGGLLLVTFRDAEGDVLRSSDPLTNQEESIVKQLEHELKATQQDLQTTIEELESSNEELKGSNEEAMSMNEELQSANEELETSKEELQSLNEELTTVNNQLQDKVEEVEGANNDLSNLLNCTDLATVFLDTGFRIKQFTPCSTRMFNLIAGDIGRPLSDIAQKFTDPELLRDADHVLRTLAPREKEVRSEDGCWFIRRILPYRTLDHRIAGVILIFTNVTEIKKAAERTRLLATVLMDSNDAVTVHDFAGSISTWNRGAERMYGYTEAEALRMNADELMPAGLRNEMLSIWHRLEQGEQLDAYETRQKTKDGRVLDTWVTATVLRDETARIVAIAKTERDITRQKRTQAHLEQEVERRTRALNEQKERLSAVLNAPTDAIITMDQSGLIESVNPAAEAMFGFDSQAMIGQNVKLLIHASDHDQHQRFLTQELKPGQTGIIGPVREIMARRKDGSLFPVELAVSEVKQFNLFTAIVRDVTERRALEREVVEIAALEQLRIGAHLHDEVGQGLTALGLLADSLLDSVQQHSSADLEVAKKVNQGLNRVLRQVRSIAAGLVTVEVDAAGLPGALRELASGVSENAGALCTFRSNEPVPLADGTKAQHLFLIAREACTNALKHGRAKNIKISLEYSGDLIILRIVDDGTGMPDPSQDGLGLRIMRHRSRVIQADFRIETVKPHGTAVICALVKEHSYESEQTK